MADQQNDVPQKPWILLAEDDIFTAKVYAAKFNTEGLAATIAEDGDKALEALRREPPPAVVFLDVALPGKSGFEVLESMKGDPRLKSIPVFMVTNLSNPADVERGLSLGAKEYLIKHKVELADMVKKAKEAMGQVA